MGVIGATGHRDDPGLRRFDGSTKLWRILSDPKKVKTLWGNAERSILENLK